MHDEILAALGRGDSAAAVDLARAATDVAPADPQAHRLLALALLQAGEAAAAHAALDRALAIAPGDPSLHYQRATLLVAEHRHDEAHAELDHTLGINPNEFRAYVLQAQIALGRGDLDEVDRLVRLAGRLDPGHAWLLTVQGMAALQRGQLEQAHGLLTRAAKIAPDQLQVRYGLGLSFMAQGHLAFAEQAFRSVVRDNPRDYGARHLLADVIRRQDRFVEAAESLEDGLAANPAMPPHLLRFAGELWLMAGEHARALSMLRRAVAAAPEDRVALDALIEALRRNGDAAEARHTLEAALAGAPQIDGLWSARLSFEPADGNPRALADRWLAAMPESVHPLHLHMWLASQKGDSEAVRDYAQRIIEREPGHLEAQTQLIEYLYRNDPPAAVAHIQSLLPSIQDPQIRRTVLGWLARAQDRAGRYADAIETWTRLESIPDPRALPLPAPSGDATAYPPVPASATAAPGPVFLFGPPGSGIEHVVAVLSHAAGSRLCADRTSAMPPPDLLQAADTPQRLADGSLEGTSVAASWRAALAMRAVDPAAPIDWLPHWDNALLHAFRDVLPGATLLLVLCDPRDMLIDWLQRGTFVRYAIPSPTAIAAWLAGVLDQLATLIDGDLMPHRVLRIDALGDDPVAFAAAIGAALGADLSAPPALGPGRYPAGHWRLYREALADPFALLAPVARRLGYAGT